MPGLDFGIGAGAQLVGGTIQAIAAKQAQQAMKEAFERELARQGRYRGEAFSVFENAAPGRSAETAREQIGAGAQNRQEQFQRIGQTQLGFGAGPTARDTAALNLAGQARANLGGYSDWQLDQMIANIRAQDELNRISNFAAGTAQVFPYRQYEAQHSQDDLAALGGLISSIGGSAPAWGQLFGGAPAANPVNTQGSAAFGQAAFGQPVAANALDEMLRWGGV